jgi:prepilin peptidase CpaA
MITDVARILIFPALMAFAASSDLFTMTISNRVTLTLVAGFAILALMTGMPLAQMLEHVGAAGVVLVASFALFTFGWIGGGDAKLAAATALWLGWAHLFDYVLYSSLLGGVLTLGLLQFRKFALPGPLVSMGWLERLHRPEEGVPYGIALAAAALLIYPYTAWMQVIAP